MIMDLFSNLSSSIGQNLNILCITVVVIFFILISYLKLRKIARVNNFNHRVYKHRIDILLSLRVVLERTLNAYVKTTIRTTRNWYHTLALFDNFFANSANKACGDQISIAILQNIPVMTYYIFYLFFKSVDRTPL